MIAGLEVQDRIAGVIPTRLSLKPTVLDSAVIGDLSAIRTALVAKAHASHGRRIAGAIEERKEFPPSPDGRITPHNAQLGYTSPV